MHVDAGDIYEAADPSLVTEAEHRQQIGFLALDLVSGRVDEHHPLHVDAAARRVGGRLRAFMPYAPASILEQLVEPYHARYRRTDAPQ